ncbi:hypothetical protein C8J95_1194 [Elizabethkingia sp. YR214]|nr:hypothetical protein C8J95_1194 [Elizabethkingia sp. YR214]
MQGLQYMTLNLRDFMLRNISECNYGAQKTVIYKAKSPVS